MNQEDTEAYKIKYEIVPYTSGTVLELGPGPWKTYLHFIGVDLMGHVPIDARDLSIFAGHSVDAVFSSYLLNEFEREERAKVLKEWWRPIKPGGYLILYLPANQDCEAPEDLLKEIGYFDLLVNGLRDGGKSILQVFQKLSRPAWGATWNKPKPEKTCAVVRYGGVGDMIQTASLLPELKAQGYHVTLYTSEAGHEIIWNDPHIDEFVVQSKDQVPNGELGAFFTYLRGRYDKLVQLSESVEGTFLAMPGRTVHSWPHGARHKLMNLNYLEIMHDIAETPYVPRPRFFPTLDEEKVAKKERKRFPGKVVLWVLSGSSAHKTWPWMDSIIAKLLLTHPDMTVVLCGDPLSEILEAGWENEPRVIKTCGKWSIRQSLAFAGLVDLVIGPETGVLNAVSMLPMPKICYLSHSSVENLTRDWVNTISLTPEDCACYPCHLLQHGFDFCSRDEHTGVAECQAKIVPAKMWEAICRLLKK